MPDYGIVFPSFWTGETGKKLKELGPECQLTALYLLTNIHRNALGIYYLPVLYLSHETGIPFEGASKALRRVCEAGFCDYDVASEVVWVYEMAKYQIGEQLAEKDKRVKWINNKYQSLPNNPFLKDFYEKYGAAFHIKKARGKASSKKPLRSSFNAPSKPLRSPSEGASCHSQSPLEAPPKPLRSPSEGASCHSQSPLEAPPKPDTDTETDTVDFSKEKSQPPAEAPDGDLPFKIPKKKNSKKSPKGKSHFSEKAGSFFEPIKTACDQILKLPSKNGKPFNPFQWVQYHINKNAHPGAINETIQALVKFWPDIREGPWNYGNAVLLTKNQNWNEKDAIAASEAFKAEWDICPEIKNLIGQIGRDVGG